MKTMKNWVAAATLVAMTGAAQAALVGRGGGMIYDTTRNLTWLADMNYAVTSGYAAANAGGTGANVVLGDGRMVWDAAVAWADQLVYGGFSDWRLPTLNPSDTSCSMNIPTNGGFPTQYLGYHCTGGELSGLFATDLGIKMNESVLNPAGDTAEQIANLALFSNVQSDIYWSGTEYAPNSSFAWSFNAAFGFQNREGKTGVARYAMAVRPGDVAAPVPVPVPEAPDAGPGPAGLGHDGRGEPGAASFIP